MTAVGGLQPEVEDLTLRTRVAGLRAAQGLFAAALLALGIFAAHYPMLLSRFRLLQTDPGDTRFNHYVLEHSFRWLRGDPLHARLWDPPFFYPMKNVLAYSDNLITVAPPYWALRAVGCDENAAFGLWMISLSVFNFITAALLLRRGFLCGPWGSSVGAFLISFGSSRMTQMGHQQLLPQGFTFLAFLALIQLFRHPGSIAKVRAAWWALFFSGTVAQIYASYYTGYFQCLILGCALVVGLAQRSQRARLVSVLRQDAKWIGLGAAFSVLALVPWLSHYGQAMIALGGRGPGGLKHGMPRYSAYLYMGQDSWLYSWLANAGFYSKLPMKNECTVGVGFVTLGVMLWHFWKNRDQSLIRVMALTTLVCLALVTKISNPLQHGNFLYYLLPGIQGIRALVRIGIFLLIPAGIAVAHLVQRQPSRRQAVVAALLVVVCCLEQQRSPHVFDAQAVSQRVAALEARIAHGEKPFFVSDRGNIRSDCEAHLDAMWAAMHVGIPTVNGYSGNCPKGYAEPLNTLKPTKDGLTVDLAFRDWLRHCDLAEDAIDQIGDSRRSPIADAGPSAERR